jgi:diguanylate cyclase (GGDEF)-like protein
LIDIQTIVLTLSIGNVGFALLMAVYIRGTAPEPSLRLWMWSRLLLGTTQFVGWLCPGTWADNGVALGCVGGVVLELSAYCLYYRFQRWERKLFPVASLGLMVLAYASARGATYVELLALTCVFSGATSMAMAFILLRPRDGQISFLQRVLGLNDVMFAIGMGLGGWDGLVHPEHALGSNPYHSFAALAGYLLMIVNSVGFLLLCKQKADAQMALLATTDFLTGLLNRRAFFERAESARMLALRLRKPIALLMLDIDHFKQLNDRFGHATGDEALVMFAQSSRGALRDHDIMGRLGGEEFALALPGTDIAGAVQVAERLRESIKGAPVITSGAQHSMTVSVGVVLIDPNETLTAALARADHALYAAKSAGRDRVEVGLAMLKRA